MSYSTIQPQDLQNLRNFGQAIDLINVRSPAEYTEIHADGAVSVPLETVAPESIRAARKQPDFEPVYIICRSGGRSRSACQKLVAAGMTNIVDVAGGTTAWEKAGLPVIRGKLPLWRRFVRPVGIALMLTFLILAVTVKWYFLIGTVAAWAIMVQLVGCPLLSMLFKPACPTACQASK